MHLLDEEWEERVSKKWKELRAVARKDAPFLSVHSPQWTMKEDHRQRRETRSALMAWVVEHFKEKGVVVRCVPDPLCCDTFAVEST